MKIPKEVLLSRLYFNKEAMWDPHWDGVTQAFLLKNLNFEKPKNIGALSPGLAPLVISLSSHLSAKCQCGATLRSRHISSSFHAMCQYPPSSPCAMCHSKDHHEMPSVICCPVQKKWSLSPLRWRHLKNVSCRGHMAISHFLRKSKCHVSISASFRKSRMTHVFSLLFLRKVDDTCHF